jgi:tRNA pseudouridine32 synthase/23S rRNA pseudouridine746 synthase
MGDAGKHDTRDHIEVHMSIESPEDSPVDLLQRATGLSKQRIKLAMTQGAVWMTRGRNTRRLRRAKRALRSGDDIHLYYDAEILAEIPPEPALIADAGGYSVWRKPCGLRSQGSKWGDHCTVVRWVERHLQPERPAFTVHRLDRAANGLILVAHSKRMAAALSALFSKREVEKRYRALVAGDFPEQPDPLRVEQPIDGKEAISEVSLLQVADDGSRSLVDVRIETGRKHQVRRHLAQLGHPVIGDRLHGSGEADGVDLQLTACLLAFHCPVNDERVEYRLAFEATSLGADIVNT